MVVGFFKLLGALIRWVVEYKCTLNKTKLSEITRDEKGKNIWFSIIGYITIIILVLILQYFKVI